MKGKQIKDELSLAMIQLFTKLLDEDSVEASTIEWRYSRIERNNQVNPHELYSSGLARNNAATAAKEPCWQSSERTGPVTLLKIQ